MAITVVRTPPISDTDPTAALASQRPASTSWLVLTFAVFVSCRYSVPLVALPHAPGPAYNDRGTSCTTKCTHATWETMSMHSRPSRSTHNVGHGDNCCANPTYF